MAEGFNDEADDASN